MDVRVHEEGPTRRRLDLTLTPEEVEAHLDRVADEFRRRTTLPGFRTGRAPRSVLEARFGGAIQEEAVDNAVNEAYLQAIQDRGLVPVSPPTVENVRYRKGEPLVFKVGIEVRPEIDLRDYRDVPLRRKVREIPDGEVDKALERIQQETARFVDLDRPVEADDVVVVDHVRVDEKGRTLKSTRVRNAPLELSNEGLLPEFRDGLIGAVPGESRTLKVQYPEDFANSDLAGRSARFHIKVRKVQEKKVRELDDNLAKEVFGLAGLEELRSRIRLQMEGEERLRSRRDLEEDLVDELLRRNEVPVPEGLAQRLTDEMIRNMGAPSEDMAEEERSELHRRYRGAVERRISREWLLDAIARSESIEVAEDELSLELTKLAKEKGRSGSEFRSLSQSQRRQRVHDAMLERKIFDFLIEAARVEEEKVKEDRLTVPS